MSKYRIVNSNISQVDEDGNLIERGANVDVPIATEHTAGIVKAGEGLTIENGTLNVNIDLYDDQELRGRIEEVEADTREHTQRLANKQDTLVSGENIKTINGEPIIGPGNITVTAEGGEPGEPGKPGKDGVGIANIEQPTEDAIRIVKTDGLWHTVTLPRGKDGNPGEPGKDGESIQGEPGKPGADGVGIANIEQPTDETMRVIKTDGTDHTLTLPRGPEGPQGPPGEGTTPIKTSWSSNTAIMVSILEEYIGTSLYIWLKDIPPSRFNTQGSQQLVVYIPKGWGDRISRDDNDSLIPNIVIPANFAVVSSDEGTDIVPINITVTSAEITYGNLSLRLKINSPTQTPENITKVSLI